MNNKTLCGLTVGAMIALAAASPLLAGGTPVGRSAAPAPLQGTWQVVITPYNCATGESYPFSFRSRNTFNAGGTMVETPFNPSFQAGQRSTGLGYWERAGQTSYHAVFDAFVNFTSVGTPPDEPFYQRGFQRVDQGIEMLDNDHWTSSASVVFRDEDNNIIPPTGCMTATGERQL